VLDVPGEVRQALGTPLVAHALQLPDQVQGMADRPQVGLEADVRGGAADAVISRPPHLVDDGLPGIELPPAAAARVDHAAADEEVALKVGRTYDAELQTARVRRADADAAVPADEQLGLAVRVPVVRLDVQAVAGLAALVVL